MWSTRSNAPAGALGSRATAAAASLALAAALATGGCTAAYVTDSTASVFLIVASVNGGAALDSDVREAPSVVVDDTVQVAVANRPKNPNFGNLPQVAMAVVLERYEVSYYRSDGRGVEGVDVPYRISGNFNLTIDVANAGTVDVPVRVVRAQAKLEPPLINLWGESPGELGGSAFIVTTFARITLHGRTVAGQAVEASGTLQINFADFPDEG